MKYEHEVGIMQHFGFIHEEDEKMELEEVYRKAKAFDLLKNSLEKKVEFLTNKVSGFPYVDAPIESTIGHFEHVLEMMNKYESGEYDE